MNDWINCAFEGLAGLFVLMHCRRVLKDKQIRGASSIATAFFTIWSAWNLYYYPSLGQWASFWAGFSIFSANLFWVCLMIKYRKA